MEFSAWYYCRVTQRIILYGLIFACILSAGLAQAISEGTVQDTFYILFLVFLIAAIAQFKKMRNSKN
jgi:hypothetical protein